MELLNAERSCLEQHLPGLDDACASLGYERLEHHDGPAIELFRDAGGCGLVIDREAGGCGASAVEAARVQRAIGARAPSLAVATTMHHFSVAALAEMSATGLESIMLEAVATSRLLVASGFAEGRPGQSVLSSSIDARRVDGGIVLNGSKKPCSLARSMDLLTASVMLDGQLAVALIPRGIDGITVEPFWNGGALRAAESDAVLLLDVEVPDRLLSYAGAPDSLDAAQIGAFVWFETLITASYIGIASGLLELVLDRPGTDALSVLRATSALEASMMAVERCSAALDSPGRTPRMLADALFARYAVQEQIVAAAGIAAEAGGGTTFIRSPEVAERLAAVHALALHPPSRSAMAPGMVRHLQGEPLTLHTS